MVDLLGGLLTAVGSAGAGGFKAAGEVADQNIKDASDQMKLDALEAREQNLERMRQVWQSGQSDKEHTFRAGETDKTIKSHEALQGQAQKHAEGLLSIREGADTKRHGETIAAQKENAAATRGQTAEARKERASYEQKMLDAKIDESKTAKEYQQQRAILDAEYRNAKTQNDKDSIETRSAEMKIKAREEARKLIADGDLNSAQDLLTSIGVKSTVIPEKTEMEGMYGFRKKVTTPGRLEYGLLAADKAPSAGSDPVQASGANSVPSPKEMQQIYRQKQNESQQSQSSTPSGDIDKKLIPNIDKTQLSEIMNRSDEAQTGIYKSVTPPGGSSSILTGLQSLASKTQGENFPKFGEGELEFAIRKTGYGDKLSILKDGDKLSILKDYADNLRKEFPKLSDADIANIVMNAKDPASQQ